MTNRTRDSLVISVFCAFFFFYGLGPFGLIGADEPRYAQVAREMLAWSRTELAGAYLIPPFKRYEEILDIL